MSRTILGLTLAGMISEMVEAPGIEPPARVVANGRKRTKADGNGRRSRGLSETMRPFATAMRPDSTVSVYQVYQGSSRRRSIVREPSRTLPRAVGS